jgi:hypothetical protein
MVDTGLRCVYGPAAAPPYTNGPYIWSNAPGASYPKSTIPYIDFNFYSSDLTNPCRQGGVRIKVERTSSYALSASDGNPDIALKVYALNSATNVSDGRVRAVDLQGRSNGNCVAVYAVESNSRISSGATCTDMIGIHHRCEIYGTVSTNLVGVDIEMSNEGAAATNSYGLRIRNTDASTSNAIGSAIYISNAGGNTGFSYLFDAGGSDACATAVLKLYDDGTVCNDTASTGSFANAAGFITVVVGSATRYIHLSSAKPT